MAEPNTETRRIAAPVEHISLTSMRVCPKLSVSVLIEASIKIAITKRLAVT
jgi:hypothetical protein